MIISSPYKNGVLCAKAGKSIHYNPYRNKGTGEQYSNWIAGYNKCQRNKSL
jgi:hypothetical protein